MMRALGMLLTAFNTYFRSFMIQRNGISCDVNKGLRTFVLTSNVNMTGSFPDSAFVNLTNLTSLIINNNPGLIGAVPTSVGLLTALDTLDFYKTGLTTLPDVFSALTNLVTLRYSYSAQSAGLLPTTLSGSTKLTSIDFAGAGMTGSVPSVYAALTKLTLLNLDTNPGLSGALPDMFGGMSNLRTFTIYSTGITGSLPLSLGKCVLLQSLTISSTRLSGPITDIFANLTALTALSMQNNTLITGNLPLGLLNTSLTTLYLAGMPNLQGSVPDALINKLQSLTLTDVPQFIFNTTAACQSTQMATNACTTWNTGSCVASGTLCGRCNIPICGVLLHHVALAQSLTGHRVYHARGGTRMLL